MQLIFIAQLEGAMFALLAHTHVYHLWATPTQRIYCASLGHISDAFVSHCQWLLERQPGSVDLPMTPIELGDYWFPTKLCAREREREGGRESARVVVCVGFVILAILMSLKTISEKVANDVRAKMELEVFRVFMPFVAAAWTISPTMYNVQRTTSNNANIQSPTTTTTRRVTTTMATVTTATTMMCGVAWRGNKKLWHFQLNCKINFHQKLAYFHIC